MGKTRKMDVDVDEAADLVGETRSQLEQPPLSHSEPSRIDMCLRETERRNRITFNSLPACLPACLIRLMQLADISR